MFKNLFPSKKYFLALTVLGLAGFISFSSSLKNDYINWDDPAHFLESSATQGLNAGNLHVIFTETINTIYIPLTTLSFAVEYHFFKHNPFVSHLINILLHVMVVMLVYYFCRRLDLSFRAAYMAAFLFAVHPMRVESIAWVTERKDVLYAVFYVGAMHAYLTFVQTRKTRFYAAAFGCGFLSMLAKPMALSLPFILLLIDYVQGRKDWLRALIEKVPFFLYVIFIAGLTMKENHDIFFLKEGLGAAMLTFIWSFSFYIVKFLWPVDLSPLYRIPVPISLSNIHFAGAIAVLSGSLCFFIFNLKNRLVVFSCLFFVFSVFFLLRVNPEQLIVVDLVADRYIYLPGLGFCLLIGYFADRLLNYVRKHHAALTNATIGIFLIIGIGLGVKSFQQCFVWKDSLAMWGHVIKQAPKMTFAYISRGTYYDEHGQYDLASRDYSQAIALLPGYVKTYIRRGILYGRMGKYDLALSDFDWVLDRRPDDWNAYSNRGNVYKLKKQYPLAIADYDKAISLNPASEISFENRGACYFELGALDQAIENFNQSLKINPRSVNAYIYRGIAYSKSRQYAQALEDFNKALLLKPNFAKTLFHRAMVLQESGNLDQAVEDYTKALHQMPDADFVHIGRGVVYGMKKEYASALKDFNEAIIRNPQNPAAYQSRAIVYRILKEDQKAMEDLKRAEVLLRSHSR